MTTPEVQHCQLIVPKDLPPGAAKSIPDDPAQAAMYKLLGARLRCTLHDGRTATGTFICMDRLKNIILVDVWEERTIRPSDYGASITTTATTTPGSNVSNDCVPVRRELAQAMIPGKHLVKVEIDEELYEKRK